MPKAHSSDLHERDIRLVEPTGHGMRLLRTRRGQSKTSIAVCIKTVGKWVERFEAEDKRGLHDRSSRPRSLLRHIHVVARIKAL